MVDLLAEMAELDFDVVVVGAGVLGSATAYHLIRNGAKRVLLLEQVNCSGLSSCMSVLCPYLYAVFSVAHQRQLPWRLPDNPQGLHTTTLCAHDG